MSEQEFCRFPDCRCPMDPGPEPDWCARGLKHQAPSSVPAQSREIAPHSPDEWYCESHPEFFMGHDGCGGAGVPADARIHMLLHKLRLTEQAVREADRMRDEIAALLRNHLKASSVPAQGEAMRVVPVEQLQRWAELCEKGHGHEMAQEIRRALVAASPCEAPQTRNVTAAEDRWLRNAVKEAATLVAPGRLAAAQGGQQPAGWDASQIKQPGWNHVQQAFVDGAREARNNPDAQDADFCRASDGYTKQVFEAVDPVSEAALRTGSWMDAAPAAPAAPLTAEDLEILRAVRRELDRDDGSGNAPGHGHEVPGIWDSDNGAKAGKPCAWCLTWRKFTALIKAQDGITLAGTAGTKKKSADA